MSKISLLSAAVMCFALNSTYAAGIGDCVEVPSKVISGKLSTVKTVLAYSQPDGTRPVRQIGIMPVMVVKQSGEYFLVANVPNDTDTQKACYNLGWVRASDVKAVPLHNCAFYSNICESGG
jgi:hypothetical protein